MGTVSRPYTYTAGDVIQPAEVTDNETTLYTLVNGNLDNDNIDSSAGIKAAKLDLASATTASFSTNVLMSLSSTITLGTTTQTIAVGSSATVTITASGGVAEIGKMTVIASATVGNLKVSGTATLGALATLGTLVVSGTATISGLVCSGTATVGDLKVSNTVTIPNLVVSGTATLGNIIASGTATLKSIVVSGTATIGDLKVSNTVTLPRIVVSGTATIGNMIISGTATLKSIIVSGTATLGAMLVSGTATFSTVPLFPNNTIETADIQDNAVTLAKMAGLARGKIIYGDASGDPAALTVGSTSTVLTTDGVDISWAAVSGGTSTYASIVVSGTATLGNIKTSGTISVSATATMDHLLVNGSGASMAHFKATGADVDHVLIESTDGGAGEGPGMAFYRNSASPADNDQTGRIRWYGNDSAGAKRHIGGVNCKFADVTNTSIDSQISMVSYKDNSELVALTVHGSDVTVAGNLTVGGSLSGAGGKVLQVVNMSTTSVTTTTSSSYVDTNLTLGITPSASSSVVIVEWAGTFNLGGTRGTWADIGLERGTSSIHSWGGEYAEGLATGNFDLHFPLSGSMKDSPNTAGAVTYTVQIRTAGGTAKMISRGTGIMIISEIGA